MNIKSMKPETLLMLGAVVGLGLIALKFSNVTVKGTAQAVGGAVVDLVGGTIGGAYEALPDAVKPSSRDNVIYQGINGIGASVTGDKDFSLGGWIYDITH